MCHQNDKTSQHLLENTTRVLTLSEHQDAMSDFPGSLNPRQAFQHNHQQRKLSLAVYRSAHADAHIHTETGEPC